jgi:hypothetical protein
VGCDDGIRDGCIDGCELGCALGSCVGCCVGCWVGCDVGSCAKVFMARNDDSTAYRSHSQGLDEVVVVVVFLRVRFLCRRFRASMSHDAAVMLTAVLLC